MQQGITVALLTWLGADMLGWVQETRVRSTIWRAAPPGSGQLTRTLACPPLSLSLRQYFRRLTVKLCCAGSTAEILSSITNQYNGNGLQQGASLVINAMLQAELKNNPVLLWMNGDVNYARSAGCILACAPLTVLAQVYGHRCQVQQVKKPNNSH